MKYRNVLFIFPALVALLALSCERRPLEYPETMEEPAPVKFGLVTKSLGTGEKTFRVALFNMSTKALLGQGTYCSTLIDHSATVTDGRWLSPCRVDNNGGPLKTDGTEASGLVEADTDSKWGLRAGTNGSCYLVAASPAKAMTSAGSQRYYAWTPSTELYVSEAVPVTLSGTWLGGQYVYESSSALELKDRRASITVHIECGELSTAYIQSVTLLNCVTAASWDLVSGFSNANYTTDSYTLFNYTSDNGGNVLQLVKENNDEWNSTLDVFLPSIDYSGSDYAAMRPQIQVLMGNDPAHPSSAIVDITEKADPMMHYTYNLYVSKSDVVITLTAMSWDNGGEHASSDTEEPGKLGTVTITGWTDGGASNTDDWNTSFD